MENMMGKFEIEMNRRIVKDYTDNAINYFYALQSYAVAPENKEEYKKQIEEFKSITEKLLSFKSYYE